MLLVWHKLISGRSKAITKKRIAILMKETKKKTSLLSLTLEPGNISLVRSIKENKNWLWRCGKAPWGEVAQAVAVHTYTIPEGSFRGATKSYAIYI